MASPALMADITRETHYVPQATLRRWSADGVHVWAYRLMVSNRHVPEWDEHRIRGLTKQRDLYTTFEGDREGDDFEKFMTREIEEPGQAAIEKLIGEFKMKPVEWHAVAKFVAAQQMRTPLFFLEWVRNINKHMPETLEAVLKEIGQRPAAELTAGAYELDDANFLREKLRITVDPAPEGDGLALVQAQVSSSRTTWLRFMRRMLTQRIDLFCNHRWRVMKLPGGEEWPLTDNPVLALNYVRPGEYDFGAGWGKHNSNFIMPVSPRLAVFTQVGARRLDPGTRRHNRPPSYSVLLSNALCDGSSTGSRNLGSLRCAHAPLMRKHTRWSRNHGGRGTTCTLILRPSSTPREQDHRRPDIDHSRSGIGGLGHGGQGRLTLRATALAVGASGGN